MKRTKRDSLGDEDDDIEEEASKRRRISSVAKTYTLDDTQELLNAYESILDTDKETALHDVTFLVGDDDEEKCTKLYAHKLILIARSEYFRVMMQSGFAESAEKKWIIPKPNVKPSVFREVLRFLYCAKANLSEDSVIEAWTVALELNIDDLLTLCAICVRETISMQNVFKFFDNVIVPDTKKLDEIKEICLNFIGEKTVDFFEMYLKQVNEDMLIEMLKYKRLNISEEDLFRKLLEWGRMVAKQHPDKEKTPDQILSDVMCNFMPLIRFPCMKISFVQQEVEPTKIVPLNIMLDTYKFLASKSIESTNFPSYFSIPRNHTECLTQLNPSTWQFKVNVDELEVAEKIDSPTFYFQNVPFFIRLYWRMKPNLPEPHLASFVVLDSDNLPQNFSLIHLAKNFTIVHPIDKEKSIVKKINRSEFSLQQKSGGKKEVIAKSSLLSNAQGFVVNNHFVMECELLP